MKLTIALVALLATPAIAEDTGKPEMSEGLSLMERGIQMFLGGILGEVEPELNDLAKSLDDLSGELGPALRDLSPKLIEVMRLMGNIDDYDMPEMQPNGDIILRRKTPLDLPKPKPGESIDL